MIRPKKYSNQNFPIESGVIFEMILNLNVTLTGQDIMIHSPFNEDNTPSFHVFYSEKGLDNYYRFKDFSTGISGDAIDLFILMYSESYNLKDRQDAYYKILELFQKDEKLNSALTKGKREIITEKKEVTSYTISKFWKKKHAAFYKEVGNTFSFLKRYCIKPLDNYELTITRGQEKVKLTFEPNLCFGFFTKAGELYKIYNPGQKKAKFVKVKDQIQGYEQLQPNKKFCIFFSSLKDAGTFAEMNFKSFNILVPDSENVEFPIEIINEMKEKHEACFTLFDNDKEGLKRMMLYKKEYQIPYIYFNIEKDLAECRKQHGPENTKIYFIEIFKKYHKQYLKEKKEYDKANGSHS